MCCIGSCDAQKYGNFTLFPAFKDLGCKMLTFEQDIPSHNLCSYRMIWSWRKYEIKWDFIVKEPESWGYLNIWQSKTLCIGIHGKNDFAESSPGFVKVWMFNKACSVSLFEFHWISQCTHCTQQFSSFSWNELFQEVTVRNLGAVVWCGINHKTMLPVMICYSCEWCGLPPALRQYIVTTAKTKTQFSHSLFLMRFYC